MSDAPPRIIAEATSNRVRSGEWIGVHGYVVEDDLPVRLAEVWLLINGRYVKCLPQTCWHERFWFHVRLGAGTFVLLVQGYKIMKEFTHRIKEKRAVRIKKEYKITSPPIKVVSFPRIINPKRLLPFTYEVENWRKINLDEGIALAKKAKRLILERYPDTSRVFLVGGVVDRGWSRRDIDLLLISPSLYEEYKVKGEPTLYRPYGSEKTYRNIKTRIKDWRPLSFEKEVERHIAYPATVMVTANERPFKDLQGIEI